MMKLFYVSGWIEESTCKCAVSNIVVDIDEKEAINKIMRKYNARKFDAITVKELELQPGMILDLV